ncbi:MAG: transcriptional repressor [Micrococcales bacterium]|nr:transcriptional repressor [Micrococcales bacterium]
MTTRRRTWQRQAILDALAASESFVSAQGLHAQLAAQGRTISLATIYRNLQDLVATGQLDQVNTDSGEAAYRACDRQEHHHHVVCRSCGTAVEVLADDVEAWAERVAVQAGYRQVEHTVEITGLCPTCP